MKWFLPLLLILVGCQKQRFPEKPPYIPSAKYKMVPATFDVMTQIGASKGQVRPVTTKGMFLFDEESGQTWVLYYSDKEGPTWVSVGFPK